MKPTLRHHQDRTLQTTLNNIGNGVMRQAVCMPTGAGKTIYAAALTEIALENGMPVSIWSPRKAITEQWMGPLNKYGFSVHVHAAEFDAGDITGNVHLCSPQTANARKNRGNDPPRCGLAIFDECHLGDSNAIKQHYEEHGGVFIIGLTATPLGLHKDYDRLVIGATNSELRRPESGGDRPVLALALCYDCGAVDIEAVLKREVPRNSETGEFAFKDTEKMQMTKVVFASVLAEYRRLNPDRKPWLVFWPGVAESKWGCDRFNEAGIASVHIDGEDIYEGGVEYPKNRKRKNDVFARLAAGEVSVIHNRFVMREGIDLPSLAGLSLACQIGSLQSYIQTVGRAMRWHAESPEVLIADHGGNIRRHGSPNQDWDWERLYRLTGGQAASMANVQRELGETTPPVTCPKCKMLTVKGKCRCGEDVSVAWTCKQCGHQHEKCPAKMVCQGCGASLRKQLRKPVIQADGTLQFVADDDYTAKRVVATADGADLYKSCFWSARKNHPERTLSQVFGYFSKMHWEKYGGSPPRTYPLMPSTGVDWALLVKDVKLESLIGWDEHKPRGRLQEQAHDG